MSNKPISEEELRQWVLSLPPSSIKSLEDTLKSLRGCHFKALDRNEINIKEDSVVKEKPEMMEDIDVSPPSRNSSSTSSNISIQSHSRSGKTYENGRRNLKEEDVPTEEANRRSKRRERNRLAAAKCRKRRQDKIETLQQRVTELKGEMEELSTNIDQYSLEHERLNTFLTSHKCTLQSSSAPRPKDLRIAQSEKSTASSDNFFICSISPQLINLSPLLTPSTMKLLIDSINSHQSDSTVTPTFDSSTLALLNLLSPNSELLNMNLLSDSSWKIAASLASQINQNQST